MIPGRVVQAVRPLVTMTILAVALAATGSASAATIPAADALQFYSVQPDGGQVLWFQRAPAKSPSKASPIPDWYYGQSGDWPGELFARPFGGTSVVQIYHPPTSRRIAGFKARAGRVVVGLDSMRSDATEIDELVPGESGWSALPLAVGTASSDDGNCGSRVSLANVNLSGEVIVDERTIQGANGGCKIVRANSRLIAFAKDGSQRTVMTRTSGWAFDAESATFDDLRAGPGDWYLRRELSYYSSGKIGLMNIETGETFDYPDVTRDFDKVELNGSGASLAINPWNTKDHTLLFPDPRELDRAVHLGRRSSITWFHLCGEQIIEIARRRATAKHSGGNAWNIWLRYTHGQVQRRLQTRLARGTMFESCDGELALFHHYLRDGRARQFSIPLNPAPAGSTGATP